MNPGLDFDHDEGMKAVFVLFGILATAFTPILGAGEVGVPDDFPTIQAAIDASSPGDVILVAPGRYRECLILKPGLTLRSRGGDEPGELGLKRAEATLVDGTGGPQGAPGVTMAEGAVLDGFTVTGVGTYDEAEWQRHWETRGDNQSHESIGHFGVPGVAVSGVTCQVRNNLVHHNGGTGIAVQGAEGRSSFPLITGNVSFRNMGGGIGAMKGATGIIEGNRCFENFHAGIGHDGASPLVTGNECYRNVRAGIGVSEGASPVVRGNHCHGNRRAGIGIRTGADTRPLVEGNECEGNEMAGIGVEEEAAPVLRDNHCHGNRLAGIGAESGANPIILGNRCENNGASGIGIRDAAPTILGNRVEKNATAGIGLDGSKDAVVIGNVCVDNGTVAIGLPKGAEAILVGNELSREGGMPPLVAVLEESVATLVGNHLRGGGAAGVMVAGKVRLLGNTLKGSDGGTGVLVRSGGGAVLLDNEISGYRNRVVKQEGAEVIDPIP